MKSTMLKTLINCVIFRYVYPFRSTQIIPRKIFKLTSYVYWHNFAIHPPNMRANVIGTHNLAKSNWSDNGVRSNRLQDVNDIFDLHFTMFNYYTCVGLTWRFVLPRQVILPESFDNMICSPEAGNIVLFSRFQLTWTCKLSDELIG